MEHITDLIGSCGTGAHHHRHVGDLNGQVVVVDERPGTLHLARLKVVLESPQVWVAEQATKKVGGGLHGAGPHAHP